MSADDRSDSVLKHFNARAAGKKSKTPAPNGMPQSMTININLDCGFGSQMDTDKWMHVGVSPKLTSHDIARARKRQQVFMADS
jgi:hypothetical protein